MRRSRVFTRGVATVLGLVLTASAFAAEPATELVVPITINTIARGETPIVIAGEDIYVPLSALERGGLTGPMWQRVQLVAGLRLAERKIGSERAVSLKALAPWATFAFDEANLTLSIDFKPDLMQRREVLIGTAKPADISYRRDPGGFFNYAITAAGGSRPSAFGEAAATVKRALVYTSFSDTKQDGLIRSLSNVSYDQRDALRRWTAGDAPLLSDELGGSGVVGGMTVARSFDIDPYFIRYPSLSLRGMAATPSQVDVYVNGVLVSRQNIEPGPFDVQNLVGVAGPTSTQVVVRDVFGREQTQSTSFYYSTAILGRGVSDYVYSAGFLRKDFSRDSFGYGDPVALAYHRYGVTDRLTVSGRVEGGQHALSGGTGASYASRLGDFDVKVAASSGQGATGTAGQIGMRRLSRRANLSAAFRVFSRDYVNFSLDRTFDRPLREAVVSAAYLPKWGNIGLQYSRGEMRDSGDRGRLVLLTNVPILDRVDLMLSAAITETATDRINEYFVGLSLHGWDRNTVNLGAVNTDGQNLVSAEVQQPLPLGDGWGYRVVTSSGAGETDGGASVQYQNRYGRYELTTPMRRGNLSGSVAGGLVLEGGKLVPTRPVSQGFALVRVPGVEGVRVYLSNQFIGKTNGSGELLIPNLLSYYGNRIRIDDRDIPMTYDVQTVEQTIAPSNRGGALVEFAVRAIRTVTGSLAVKSGSAEAFIPVYGQLTLERHGKKTDSPVGAGGEFYFENLSAGTYSALIEYETGSCKLSLVVPDSKQETIDLGRVVCTGAAKP